MALLTQYASFFISPFGESSVTAELNQFLKSHRIINVEKKLTDGERGTGWLFLVEYGSDEKNSTSAPSPRVDYREVLSETEFALFDKLRNLRKEIAENQGIPVYAVFTNEQLAGMVKKCPKNEKEMRSIAGVGQGRVKQFGERFMRFFADMEASQNEKSELLI